MSYENGIYNVPLRPRQSIIHQKKVPFKVNIKDATQFLPKNLEKKMRKCGQNGLKQAEIK